MIKRSLYYLSKMHEEQRSIYEMLAKILKDKISTLNKAKREGIEQSR